MSKYIRHGIGAARPYLFGNLATAEFVKTVFGAVELERAATGENEYHIETQIGDAVIVLEVSDQHDKADRGVVYVYVEDVDAAYHRAMQLGATSLGEPTDKTYNERGAGVKDTFGNTWWISTYTG